MSAVLGPIHFWLYNKIGLQEELMKEIAEYAVRNGWITDKNEYCKDLPALESAIDQSNIHGWLQEQISDAETRYAGLIGTIMNEAHRDAICQVAFDFGKAHAIDPEVSVKEAYQAFEDFFVNGMPCDRVNQVVLETDEKLSWTMTKEIHAQYWGEKAELYYSLRNAIMCGMLEETGLTLEKDDSTTYTIKRK